MDQKPVSTPDSPPPSASDSSQSVPPAPDPLPAEKDGEQPPSLPVIVLPPDEVVVPVITSADPLLDNPDYMALKKFVEERKMASLEESEQQLSEESLIQ